MRKFVFAVAALFVSVSMSAQLWVGGSLEFKSKSFPQEGKKSRTEFTINPVAGYSLSDVFEVGAGVKLTTVSGLGGSVMKADSTWVKSDKSTEWSIAPFVRYHFLQEEKFNLFLEAGFEVGQYKVENRDGKFSFNIGVKPGIAIPLNENLSIVSTFGWLGFIKDRTDEKTLKLSLASGLSFGLYYAF